FCEMLLEVLFPLTFTYFLLTQPSFPFKLTLYQLLLCPNIVIFLFLLKLPILLYLVDGLFLTFNFDAVTTPVLSANMLVAPIVLITIYTNMNLSTVFFIINAPP